MKLYYAQGVCSLAVRIMLHELHIECAYEAVDLKNKVTEQGIEFLKINPKGAVPVLEIAENEYLTESIVILQFIADKVNGTELLPAIGDDLKRYRTLEWLNFFITDLHWYGSMLLWSKIPTELNNEVFLPLFNKKLSIVEQQLKDNPFITGNKFSLPDCYLVVIIVWMKKMHMDLEVWPHLYHYFEEIRKREAIALSLEEENLLEVINS